MKFSIVDVFSQGKYTGNQLAVFKEAGHLSTEEMQKIAKEINFSETTFILSNEPTEKGYPVRIFTPNEEVPFAGHPTLGTAFVIQQDYLNGEEKDILLHFKAGTIPVTYNAKEKLFWMKQNQPTFGKVLDSKVAADVLGLAVEEIDHRFPVQDISTGLPAIIVPLVSLEAVRKAKVNLLKYNQLIQTTEGKTLFVFSKETYDSMHDINARDFAHYFGIPEDAATGSSNGCLASYLVHHNYFNKHSISVKVEQGYEIGRPSLLHLNASQTSDGIDVYVGGQVEKVAEGKWG
ncbi:PhzF family phenazine biosynthesis protein [Priestia flexa]